MYVVNETKYDNSVLNPLIQFVLTQMPIGQLAWLHMVDGGAADPMEVTGGLAEGHSPFPADPSVPHRVTLWLRLNPQKYPYKTCHRKSVGEVSVDSWEEEFVLVLAHELRHVHQFVFGTPRNYEVDAERHAIAVLTQYRNRGNRRAA